MAQVTVLAKDLDAFKKALPATGCTLTGRQRRPGKNKFGNKVVDVEFDLPSLGSWRGSMTETIYDLPGVLRYGAELFGKNFLGKITEFIYWNLRCSGN